MGWVSPSVVRYRACYSARNVNLLFKIDKQACIQVNVMMFASKGKINE